MRKFAILLALGLVALACPALAAATEPLPETPDAGIWTPNSSVSAVATAGGTTYIGGYFNYVGPPTGAAVRLDAGGHATPLGPVTGWVGAAVADAAGGVYLGGDLMRDDGTRVQIVHVLADGSIDPGFAAPKLTGSFAGVRALALSGTKLYVGGRSPRRARTAARRWPRWTRATATCCRWTSTSRATGTAASHGSTRWRSRTATSMRAASSPRPTALPART